MDNFVLHLLLVTCTFSLLHICLKNMQISTAKEPVVLSQPEEGLMV